MHKSQVLKLLLVSFLGGIFWRSFFAINSLVFFFLAIFSLILLFIFYKNKLVLIVGACLLLFVAGNYETEKSLQKIELAEKKNLAGQEILQQVVVGSDPAEKNSYQQFYIFLQNEKEKILVRTPKEIDLAYGDRIELNCALTLVKNQQAENVETVFDYRMYLAKENVFYLCQKAKVQIIEHDKGNVFYAGLIGLRKRLENVLVREMPQPEAGLASGILFGGNALLTKEMAQKFSRTGLTHIVAVSGFNVTIIVEYLVLVGIWLGLWRKSAINFALAGILVFVLMVGFPASAVRAGVMGSAILWAVKNGRLANSFNALILAAAVMLALNPLLLRWDVGFQLSFLATAGILLTSDWWENEKVKKYDKFGFAQAMLLTVSAQLLALPVIVYNFQTASPISLLANALILSLIPVGMLLVFLTSLVGMIFAPLAIPFAWLAFAIMHYIIKVVEFLASLSWASVNIGKVSWEFVIWYYIVMLLGIFLITKLRKIKYAKQA